ncbi:MAG: LUD domain-containing protein [Pseudoxanthomonas sp.]
MNTQASHDARSAILSRLRAAAPDQPDSPPDVAAYYNAGPSTDRSDIVSRFIERARSWQAEVIETDRSAWIDTLAAVLKNKGVRCLLAGRNTALSPALEAAALPCEQRWYDQPLASCKDALFDEIDAGITTTRGGIAETGSLVLWPGRDEPRTLSLVPPLHIAVLEADALHETLHAVIHAQDWVGGLPTNALLVTGPSKTADIQRLLVYGAHGPKQLVILLVRGT